MIKIDKGIPAPTVTAKAGRAALYPFAAMVVGDSFAVPGVKVDTMKRAAYHAKKKTKATYRVAAEGLGVRVWRTA